MKPTSRLLTNFFKHLLFVVKVEGESAFPELIPGRYYLASSLKRPQVGRFVVFSNPLNHGQILVKKVQRFEGDSLCVQGTVSWAVSSREIGRIPLRSTLGVLLTH